MAQVNFGGLIRITRGLERFFSQLNIQRYRKLFEKSTDEPERGLRPGPK